MLLDSTLNHLANITNMGVASGAYKLGSKMEKLGSDITIYGIFAFVFIIPFILLPFTWVGAIVVGIIIGIVTGLALKYAD